MSKNTDEITLTRHLEKLGLTEKESRVYVALLPHRDIGSSKLIRATGLHGQFVYNALEKLEEKGLAKHVVQNGRKKFSASTPMRILSLLEEKRLAAQSVIRELQTRFAGAHEQDFEILQGVNAFVAHQLMIMKDTPENSRIDVISGPNDKYFSILNEEGVGEEFESERIRKHITTRYLGSEKVRERLQKMERERKHWIYRISPGLSTGMVDMSIWPNSILINLFGDPILSFHIESKDMADGYREFFETLWGMAKK